MGSCGYFMFCSGFFFRNTHNVGFHMSRAPLYDLISGIPQGVRFHTPGHKGRLGGIFNEIAKYDVTELPTTDDLYSPTGAILQAEILASEYFNTQLTFFSAGGATLCIQAALTFFRGKKIIVERNCHVSVFNACGLLNITPVFIYNQTDVLPLPVTPQQVEDAIIYSPDACAVFLTSPNYYGLCADLKKIKKVCENHNVKLIVDNSHGTHMYVTDRDNCAQKNSDICVDSAHKTLPVLTGGAFLHINFKTDRLSVKETMRLFGSTSPSFLILASLDYARNWLQNGGEEEIRITADKVKRLKEKIKFTTAQSEPLRITVIDENAEKIASLMLETGINYEMHTPVFVVLLFSPFNTEEDFTVVENFFNSINIKPQKPDFCYKIVQSNQIVPYIDAILSPYKKVPAMQALGKISARNILPYPPGVPVVLAGEKILNTEMISGQIYVLEKDE
ncbi:MAG: hypothetical protein DBX47_03640 [Clostridiales bacterium]|nr:MAG: hypothetical protein DBX47_03640 [Clostridiales bacterium]